MMLLFNLIKYQGGRRYESQPLSDLVVKFWAEEKTASGRYRTGKGLEE